MNPCKDLDVPVYHDTELFICSKNLAHELNTQHCTKRCVNSSLFYCNVSSARYRISFFFAEALFDIRLVHVGFVVEGFHRMLQFFTQY